MGDPGVLVMVPVQAAVGVGMRQLLCSAVLQLSSSAISTSSSGERTRIIIINYVYYYIYQNCQANCIIIVHNTNNTQR